MSQRWLFTFLLPRNLAEGEESFFLLELKTIFWIGISVTILCAKTMGAAGSSGDVKGPVF